VQLATRPRGFRNERAEITKARRRRVAVRLLAGLLVLGSLLVLGATSTLFLWPESDAPRAADALVVLGPGRDGERFRRALSLERQDYAPVVVVSESRDPARWPIERQLCATPHALCFRAQPFTTRGETRIVANLAREHGWRSLLVVTSTYHVTRARLLYDRCFRGRVTVVAAKPSGGLAELVATTLHEWGGLLDAVLLARTC
jgi:uncharacterized SAM-binding protein YcdF (DUF218 family)